ncbi:slr1306 family protein [Pantanalinema sp. GBBB05]|uniref:slr1306 family protein n=1 Tax=Pantanalinema sp. GBBB05 TaxID=2604139 RepID=UPI003D81AA02
MMTKLQQPLLVGGVALVSGVWLLSALEHAIGEWSMYGLFLAAIGVGVWWLRQPVAPPAKTRPAPSEIDTSLVEQEMSLARQVISQLATEAETPEANSSLAKSQVSLLQARLAQLGTELQREDLRFMVMGAKGSGKTTLIQLMQGNWLEQTGRTINLYEAPSFSVATADGLTADTIAMQQATIADLMIFLVTGDITESEYQTLKQLAERKRLLLALNKQDLYLPEERQTIFGRLQERGQAVLPLSDVVAIATSPNPLKVRQHQLDGEVQEWLEDQTPDIAPLTQRLDQIMQQESQQLVLASCFDQAVSLKQQANLALHELRRARALPMIEQFQWISAATAFASPLPTLDVLAAAAINGQMILDLGNLYQQKFSLQQAQKAAATLGSLMLKLGLVELSTQAIAGLLKTNAMTYIAGGCIQGISAAYLTRVAGLTLVEYFHTQEPNLTVAEAKPFAIDRLSQILQTVFQQHQQPSLLQVFIGQASDRLLPKLTANSGKPALESTALTGQTAVILEQNGASSC